MVHISQIYPCDEIISSSELFYVTELGKYLSIYYDDAVSIDGVVLKKELRDSNSWDYFRLGVSNGWLVDTNLPSYETDISIHNPLNYKAKNIQNILFGLDKVPFDREDNDNRVSSWEYAFKTPLKAQACFTKVSDENWVWTYDSSSIENKMVNTKIMNKSKAWLSFVAFVAIHRLKTGVPKLLGIEFPTVLVSTQLCLSDFIILSENSNALKGWVVYSFDVSVTPEMQRQVGYEAWYYKGADMGMLSRWYSPKEKLAYMAREGIEVGDIVMLFERHRSSELDYLKSIKGCRFAIVRGISVSGVKLEIVNTTKTRYGAELNFQDNTQAVKALYCNSTKYKEWNATNKTIDLLDLGIEYYMHQELCFITKLDQSDDLVKFDVSDYKGRSGRYLLHQNDIIYWLLKDYGIEFNEDKFLSTYFKNSMTAYNVYMSGSDLPESWRVE